MSGTNYTASPFEVLVRPIYTQNTIPLKFLLALIMPWSIVAKPPQASGRGALPVEVVVEPAKPAKACVQALAQ
ncbi:hypothetical protein, partial [Rhabdochromatium marinum]|uniref:hypothetical protein n=1 Tax=Rhabdochromatium marinum TaxID=48729 RepID=UPI001A932DE1